MKVIVDSSVWSLALRRNRPIDSIAKVNVLQDLIAEGRVVLLGAIRQELFNNIKSNPLDRPKKSSSA